jgi:hypothetical protein
MSRWRILALAITSTAALMLPVAAASPRGGPPGRLAAQWQSHATARGVTDGRVGKAEDTLTAAPFDAEVYLDPGAGPTGGVPRYALQRAHREEILEPGVWVEGPDFDGPIPAEAVPLQAPWFPTAIDCQVADAPPDVWALRILPDGLIYRAYLAGFKESRISGTAFYSEHRGWLLDVTLGGRVGILRYGTEGGIAPEGWEIDIEGAGFPRLNLDKNWDLESADFRFGIPVTYGVGNLQAKFAYYHLSAHLGDELAFREPQLLASRINFSRDVLVLGLSYFPHPAWRLYGEAGWSFYSDGGSDPWEFQFGTELIAPGKTTLAGSPFVAINGHLRQEVNYGGDLAVQAGWAWRGRSGHLLRIGGHYLNGMSTQFEFFDQSERQIGVGLWYDY